MLKHILLSILLCGASFAAFEDEVKSLLEAEMDMSVNIISVRELNKDFKVVLVKIGKSNEIVPLLATKNGREVIVAQALLSKDAKTTESYLKIINEVMTQNKESGAAEAGKLIKQLKSEQYIALKSEAKNAKTMFIVSDPNCGYCKNEFRQIDEKLKTHNINMVMVGILGEDSLKKSAYAFSKLNAKSSQGDKMNVLKEIFSANFKAPKNIDTSKIKATNELLFSTGAIRGVPYIYEE